MMVALLLYAREPDLRAARARDPGRGRRSGRSPGPGVRHERRGDELPAELADPTTRRARLREAKRRLDEEWQAKQDEMEAWKVSKAEYTARTGRTRTSAPPKPRPIPPAPEGRINITDPDSRAVKTARGFIQGGIRALVNPAADSRCKPTRIRSGPLYEQMRQALEEDDGRQLYRERQAIIEPVFPHTKITRHADRFQRRGLAACRPSGG